MPFPHADCQSCSEVALTVEWGWLLSRLAAGGGVVACSNAAARRARSCLCWIGCLLCAGLGVAASHLVRTSLRRIFATFEAPAMQAGRQGGENPTGKASGEHVQQDGQALKVSSALATVAVAACAS